MAARPQPKKSNLAGSSPVTPQVVQKPVEHPTTRAQETQSNTSSKNGAITAAEQRPEDIAPKRKYPAKVSFYQDIKDTDRVRSAILHTMISEGNRNLSQFINKAVMAEVERLEKKYNDGNHWSPVKAKEMPQGAASHGRKTNSDEGEES